jgi:hypothetical protein
MSISTSKVQQQREFAMVYSQPRFLAIPYFIRLPEFHIPPAGWISERNPWMPDAFHVEMSVHFPEEHPMAQAVILCGSMISSHHRHACCFLKGLWRQSPDEMREEKV